jgi:hypothetical protein
VQRNDGVAETLTVHVVSDTTPFEAQVGKLRRMSATDTNVVATIYRMDFDIGDEDARERVVKHIAERAPAAYDSGTILELVSDTD